MSEEITSHRRGLTDEQRAAVQLSSHPTTLVAGAGSGKTTVLVQRYVALIQSGVKPREILTVTFTNEAAQQLRDRIRAQLLRDENPSPELLESVEIAPSIGTIHSLCYRILDQYGSLIGLEPIQGILTPFEMATRFDTVYRTWLESLDESELTGLLTCFTHGELRKAARDLFNARFAFRRALKESTFVASPEEGPLWQLLSRALEPFFVALEADFAKRGVYSFDDLENLALRILQESPETATRLQSEIKFLLVDEFQDTSRLQWEILKTILGASPGKLFVVGDPKQSIYGFRHADVSLFFGVAEEMAPFGGKVQELTANFRSKPTLLEAINHLSETLFLGSSIPFQPMRSGIASAETGGLFLRRYDGTKAADAFPAELQEVVTATKALLREHPPESLAILFRVSDRIPDYHRALTREGIPAECRRSSRLFDCYDVLDLATYLRAVQNPLDDFHFAGFLRTPYVNFSYQDLWDLQQLPGETLFERALGDKRLGWFFALVENGDFRVRSALSSLFASCKHWPTETEALMALLAPLSEEGLSVPEAVTRIATWEAEDISFQAALGGRDNAAVRLMTVHAAKGLEFPHVFLVDNLRGQPRRTPTVRLHPGFAPGIRYRKNEEAVTSEGYERIQELQTRNDAEESKRILYVALTRAEQTLTLFLPRDPQTIPKGTWAATLQEAVERMQK